MAKRTKVECACGCGKKFLSTRYSHRYATRACFIRTYVRPKNILATEKPKKFMTKNELAEFFGFTPSRLFALTNVPLAAYSDGTYNMIDMLDYFLRNEEKFPAVTRKLVKNKIIGRCEECHSLFVHWDYVNHGLNEFLPRCHNHLIEGPTVVMHEDLPYNPTNEEVLITKTLAPLTALFTTIAQQFASLEKRLIALEARPVPMLSNPQQEAEIIYLKEAIRKAQATVEDSLIRSSATESRLNSLERELGVTV